MPVEPGSAVFHGRTSERQLLTDALYRTAAAGAGAVLLGGEAGVGKTRLVAEFARAAADGGAVVLAGRALELADAPSFWPVVSALRSHARQGRGPAAAEVGERLTRLGDRDTGSAPGRVEMLGELCDLVGRVARDGPLVLAVDDLHWADRSTRDLFAYLLAGLAAEPVLLVGTYRDDPALGVPPVLVPLVRELRRHPTVSFRRVEPMPRDELAALLAAWAPDRPDLEPLVWRHSGGNVLLAEETVRAVLDGDPRGVPATLRDLIRAAAAGLTAPARDVVRTISAGVGDVSHPLLAAVVDRASAELAAAVREAVEAGFVVVSGGESYRLRHGLMTEVVAADLLPAERVEVHGRYARALAAGPDAERPGTAARLAHHWHRSGHAAEALVATLAAAEEAERLRGYAEAHRHWLRAAALPAPDERSRDHYLERAAAAADLAGDHEAAVALLAERLAGSGPPSGVEEAVLRGRLGRYLLASGQAAEAEESFRRAAAALPSPIGDGPDADPLDGPAVLARVPAPRRDGSGGTPLRAAGGGPASLELVAGGGTRPSGEAPCLDAAPPGASDPDSVAADPADAARAEVLAGYATALLARADFSAARGVAQQALGPARRVGEPRALASVLGVLGFGAAYTEDPAAGLAALSEAVTVAEGTGDPTTLGQCLLRRADLLSGPLNALDDGVAEARAGADRMAGLGLGRTASVSLRALAANGLFRKGSWDEAEEEVARAWAAAPRGAQAIEVRLARARLRMGRGDLDGSEEDLAAVELVAATAGTPGLWLPLLILRAGLEMWRGRPDEGFRHVGAGLDVVESGVDDVWAVAPLLWHGARAHAEAVLAGLDTDPAGVRRLRRHRHALVGRAEGAAPALRAVLATFEAMCTAEDGRITAGADPGTWGEVADLLGRLGQPYPTAYARLRSAEVLLGRRRTADGTTELLRAAEGAHALRAAPLLAQIGELARRSRVELPLDAPRAADPVPPAPPGDDPIAALTGRELEVLEVLARGATNRQIAETLFIAPKTVGAHLGRIFDKLGVSNRTRAAAVLHRYRPDAGRPPA